MHASAYHNTGLEQEPIIVREPSLPRTLCHPLIVEQEQCVLTRRKVPVDELPSAVPSVLLTNDPYLRDRVQKCAKPRKSTARSATSKSQKLGEGKPETFDCLP
jgi:hypothetical protein